MVIAGHGEFVSGTVAYFDESGTHGQQSSFLIAGGFAASADEWLTYKAATRDLFDRYKIKYFHAADFRSSKRGFKGWPADKKAQFNYEMLSNADIHIRFGLAVQTNLKLYDELYRSNEKGLRIHSAYGLTMRVAVDRALDYVLEHSLPRPLDIIAESGHRNARDLSRIFSLLKKQPENTHAHGLLGELRFEDKLTCVQLSAADQLVYNVFRMSSGFSSPARVGELPAGICLPPFVAKNIDIRRVQLTGVDMLAFRTGRALASEPRRFVPFSRPY